jgi:hypothetical protein
VANTTGFADIRLPLFEVRAGIQPATTGDGNLRLPLFQVSGSDAGIRLPVFTIAGTGLSGTITAPGAFGGGITLPLFTLAGEGVEPHSGRGEVTLPLFVVEANSANTGRVKLPLFSLAGVGLNGSVGNGRVSLPLYSLAAAGRSDTVGSAAIQLPLFRLAGSGLPGSVGVGAIRLPLFAVLAGGLSGSVGNAVLTLPIFTVDAAGHSSTSGVAAITLPLFSLAATSSALSAPSTLLSALVLETESTRLTTYSNFAFNSLAEFNGVFLGANANGIYALAGDTDALAPIQATVKPGITDFNQEPLKRLIAAYVGYRTSGEMTLTVTTEMGGAHQYPLKARTVMGLDSARVKLGKGVKARYFQLCLQNRGGVDFELDQVGLDAQLLSRRVG